MVKISPQELHLIAVLCANANHPLFAARLAELSPVARAVAILILRQLVGGKYVRMALPEEVAKHKDVHTEVQAAAVEFTRMLNGRFREHELRMEYSDDTAHSLEPIRKHA